jgi:hypothetical protein
MALPVRQFMKRVTKLFSNAVKTGKILTSDIVDTAAEDSSWVPGRPFMTFRRQSYKGQLDVGVQNQMLSEIGDDLGVLYEEYQGLLTDVLRKIATSEATYDRYRHETSRLQGMIDDLILLTPGTDIGLVVSDGFIDLANVDQANSDAGFDMQGNFVSLRPIPGAARIEMTHLEETINPGVHFNRKDVTVDEIRGGLNAAVTDVADGWVFTAASTSSGPVEATFDLQLVPDGDPLPYVSRIDFTPHSFTPFWLRILASADGVNFTTLPGQDATRSAQGERMTYVFPSRKLYSVRFIMSRTAPDGTMSALGGRKVPIGIPIPVGTDTLHTYSFGAKLIAAYDQGYARESTLTTKSLTPTGVSDDRPIDKITIVADENIPRGTDIEYEISWNGGSNWAPITPLGRESAMAANLLKLDIPSSAIAYEYIDTTPGVFAAIGGKNFYSIFAFPNEPIRDSVRIDHGEFGWRYEESPALRKSVELKNYISFAETGKQGQETEGDLNVQPLYRIEYEDVSDHDISDGVNPTSIRLNYPLYPTGMLGTYAEREGTEEQPFFQVLKLIRKMDPGTISSTTVAVTVIVKVGRNQTGDPYQPTQIILVDFTTTAPNVLHDNTVGRSLYEFVDMMFHYNFEMPNGKTCSGAVPILSAIIDDDDNVILTVNDKGAPLLDGTPAIKSWFIPEMNIKAVMLSATGSTVRVLPAQPLLVTDVIQTVYRRKLLSTEKVVKGSVIVDYHNPKEQYTKGRSELVEGADYKIAGQSIIRMASGRIRTNPSDERAYIVVHFNLEMDYAQPSSFTTYLYAEGPGVQVINMTPIAVNTGFGEEIYVGDHRVDSVETLTIKPGWNRVTVKSAALRHPDGMINRQNAFYKFINSTDTRGLYIMPAYRQPAMTGNPAVSSFASYFTRQSAYMPSRMSRTNAHHLTTGVKPDMMQEWFAVKQPTEIAVTAESRVLLGYDPATEDNILIFPPDVDGDAEPETAEMFKISYSFILGESTITSVVLRATLTRGTDPTVTPLLYRYTLRFSF